VGTDGTTGAAATVYFATDPRATADPTPPGFTPAEGVDTLLHCEWLALNRQMTGETARSR